MICSYCTFLNSPNTLICEMCSKTLKMNVVKDEQLDGITCNACTFINDSDADSCCICGKDFFLDSSTSDSCSGSTVEDELTDLRGSLKDMFLGIDEKTKKMLLTNVKPVEASQKECEICNEIMGTDFFAMFECTDTFCNQCAVNYFTVQITEKTILDCNCPVCDYPNLHTNLEKHEGYFSFLLASLKPILDSNIMNVFEKKLTETALLSDPKFVWCIRCTSGFVNDALNEIAQCPDCRVRFCFKCKVNWDSQHKNISCEQYANWLRDNNPELSNEAIKNYLLKNGIDCPKCKFKYDLSRGGCIHFTCRICKYEFCFGCSKPFLTGSVCKVSTYCKKVGLHAHHARNCYYYLRDKSIADLQGLLKANNIQFIVEASEQMHRNSTNQHCRIELQIETANGIVDTVCEKLAKEGHAGLCSVHYAEYLIFTIRKANLETLQILTVHNCQELLRFQGIAVPIQSSTQSDDVYKDVCQNLVKNNIALQ